MANNKNISIEIQTTHAGPNSQQNISKRRSIVVALRVVLKTGRRKIDKEIKKKFSKSKKYTTTPF